MSKNVISVIWNSVGRDKKSADWDSGRVYARRLSCSWIQINFTKESVILSQLQILKLLL